MPINNFNVQQASPLKGLGMIQDTLQQGREKTRKTEMMGGLLQALRSGDKSALMQYVQENPESMQMAMQAQQFQQAMQPKKEPDFTLGEGQQRFDAHGNVIAENIPKEEVDREKELKIKKLEKELKMLDDPSLPVEDKVKIEKDLRAEIFNRSKEFEKIDDAYDRIQASVKEPSGAGDLALIFNYMKMLDPGSTVREGEFATAASSAGLPQRFIAAAARVDSGERLSPKQRADFFDRAKRLYKPAKTKNTKLRKRYESLAKKYNVDSTAVVMEDVAAPAYTEGQTATDANGNKIVYQGGQWIPL